MSNQDSSKRKTMEYSMINEQELERRNSGTISNVPTRVIPNVNPPSYLNIKRLITNLIEINVDAWKSLPLSVQEMMMDIPTKFKFSDVNGGTIPDIIYNGVRLRWTNNCWTLVSIEVVP
jgi:hypothetical protein